LIQAFFDLLTAMRDFGCRYYLPAGIVDDSDASDPAAWVKFQP